MGQVIKIAPIKPSAKAINFTRSADAAKLGLKDAAEDALKDMQKTSATWSHQPDFTIKEQKDGYLVGTDNAVWGMLDKGTPKHVIRAKRGKRLRFGTGGSPKTRAGFVGSVNGTAATGGPVFKQEVNHPGTTARGWSKLIAAKYRVQMQRYISKRIKEAL